MEQTLYRNRNVLMCTIIISSFMVFSTRSRPVKVIPILRRSRQALRKINILLFYSFVWCYPLRQIHVRPHDGRWKMLCQHEIWSHRTELLLWFDCIYLRFLTHEISICTGVCITSNGLHANFMRNIHSMRILFHYSITVAYLWSIECWCQLICPRIIDIHEFELP